MEPFGLLSRNRLAAIGCKLREILETRQLTGK
jgi:hypothetical protein